MTTEEKSIVSLKEAFITGVVLDMILIAMASTIMDGGGVMMRMLFLVVAHWVFNIWLILRYKNNLGRYGRDFIRFGIFILIAAAAVIRVSMLFFWKGNSYIL